MVVKVQLVLVLILLALLSFNLGAGEKVVFLDVGQGDSILLQDGAEQVLVDGGPGMAVLERLGEEMPWFDRKIEVVVLTHPQRDHVEGLIHVLERYEVGMVLLPNISTPTLMQEKWLNKIIEQGVPYRFAWAGQEMEVGNIKITVLGPMDSDGARTAARSDINNGSTVTRVDYYDMSLLLTGDIEKRVERLLVDGASSELLDVGVLKVGHHGSKSSTGDELLWAASPVAAVVSVGENKYGHPHADVLGRLGETPVWRTDEDGSVTFQYLDGQWYAGTQRGLLSI